MVNDKIIIGVLARENANQLIDNLIEADFDERDMSIIMREEKEARMIHDDNGPLKGAAMDKLAEYLTRLNMDQTAIHNYISELKNDKVLVAVKVQNNTIKAVKESFEDFETELIHII